VEVFKDVCKFTPFTLKFPVTFTSPLTSKVYAGLLFLTPTNPVEFLR